MHNNAELCFFGTPCIKKHHNCALHIPVAQYKLSTLRGGGADTNRLAIYQGQFWTPDITSLKIILNFTQMIQLVLLNRRKEIIFEFSDNILESF